jgi:hypothetical protein
MKSPKPREIETWSQKSKRQCRIINPVKSKIEEIKTLDIEECLCVFLTFFKSLFCRKLKEYILCCHLLLEDQTDSTYNNIFWMACLECKFWMNSKLKDLDHTMQSGVSPTWVLFFCVGFWEFSHLARDLSQTEKKTNFVTSWTNAYTSLKMVEVVILSENSCHFVSCLACNNSYFLLSMR